MKLLKKHSIVALVYFFLIALLGLVMRLFPVVSIPVNYKFLVHTHSHIALLGWIYTALTTLIYYVFLEKQHIKKRYKNIFAFTQFTIIGMLLTFPFIGYAVYSIVFSTLFLFASYLFSWLVFKHTPSDIKKYNSYKLIRIALWFMIISSIGPWTLGVIMSTLGSASSLYKNAIYFYLHFQYNGWFLVAILGLFTRLLELKGINFSKKEFSTIFWLFNSGVVLTFFISILWMNPPIYIYVLSAVGSLFQLIAFYLFIKKYCKTKLNTTPLLLMFITILSGCKLVLQFLGSFPYTSEIVSSNTDLIIAYIHWVFLGIASLALLHLLEYYKLIKLNAYAITLYIVGFVLTEALLFYKGTLVWLEQSVVSNYYIFLAIASALLFLSIGYLCVYQISFKKKQ
jgi:hypothetical protein